MPSSAAIGSAKNKFGAQLHTGNREQLSLFYWSMFSSLLEAIDLLFVSNQLGCGGATFALRSVTASPLWSVFPLLSFRFASNIDQEQYTISEFRIYASFKPLSWKQHWGRAMSPQANVHGTVASEALRPASPKTPAEVGLLICITQTHRNMWLWWNPGKLSWP